MGSIAYIRKLSLIPPFSYCLAAKLRNLFFVFVMLLFVKWGVYFASDYVLCHLSDESIRSVKVLMMDGFDCDAFLRKKIQLDNQGG